MSGPHPDVPRPDVSRLADLDAGVLDEAQAREVRAAAEADPAARAVLEALAATRADLAAVDDPPVPPAVDERWRAALRAEQSPLAPAPHSPAADRRRHRHAAPALVRRPAVLAAVLLGAVLVGAGLLRRAKSSCLPSNGPRWPPKASRPSASATPAASTTPRAGRDACRRSPHRVSRPPRRCWAAVG